MSSYRYGYKKIHTERDKSTIGVIDNFIFEITTESNNGSMGVTTIGKVAIIVYSDEGPVPHFHIEGNDFSCCVCIFDNRYFDHGIHQDILNRKQLKELDSFMREISKNDPYHTNWELCKLLWEVNNISDNSNIGVALRYKLLYKHKNKQPDYTKIDGYRRN